MPFVGNELGYQGGTPAGDFFGVDNPGLMEQISSLGGPSFGGPSGMGGSSGMGGESFGPGLSDYQNMGDKGHSLFEDVIKKGTGFAKNFGLKDLKDAALIGTSIIGTLKGKRKERPEESLSEQMQKNRPYKDPADAWHPPRKRSRKTFLPPEDYRPGIDPQWSYFGDWEYEDEDPEAYQQARVSQQGAPRYRKGGHVKGGYVKGKEGGQADTRPASLKEGDYVMDSTSVSLLGDGNSDNGAKTVKNLQDSFLTSGITKDLRPSRNVKAFLSDGEVVIKKEAITNLGNGDNKVGSQKMDKFRKNLRRHKGVKKFLPPKTKNLEYYMR
jgi:hypothetical protein